MAYHISAMTDLAMILTLGLFGYDFDLETGVKDEDCMRYLMLRFLCIFSSSSACEVRKL